MKKLLFVAALLISQLVIAQKGQILVSPKWLKENISNPSVVVLQVGFLRLDYEKEHIAGARFLWPGWLAPDSPEGSMNVPDLMQATEILQNLGISNNSHVILCHVRNEVSVTSRMFLMLEYLGLKGNVSFLNGGLEAWKKEGFEVTSATPPAPAKGKFKPAVNPVVVNSDYVLKSIESPNTVIVDARYKRFYDGEPTGYPRDGHIKSAKNIPYNEMVDESNVFKSNEDLEKYFTPVSSKDKEVVAYCFIGQTASVVYLAGRILGYDMKLYDGSMQEWTRREELPMEKTEN